MKRQAVITGLGIVSPIGTGVAKFWQSALAGRSGIGRPTLFDASNLPPECQIVGEVRDFNYRDWMPGQSGKMAGRFSQFAVAAAKMALEDSGLGDLCDYPPQRVMLSIGTSMSGVTDVIQPNIVAFFAGDPILPWTVLEFSGHAATSHIAIATNARGPSATFATACVAGLDAIAWAAEQVKQGKASIVFAGGTETPLSQPSIQAFKELGALATWQGRPQEASRPFEKLRSGLVLAEGAAVVVVEEESSARARGAHVYARILGSGRVTEAAHLRTVDETGQATSVAVDLALRDSLLSPTDIDYVCAHGNSLVDYDAAETAGLKTVLGRRAASVPVSSIKSMCGQALAASGAMQVVTTCLAIRDNVVPPTINYEVPDPVCDLDYVPNKSRVARVRAALVHAQSIGGTHIATVVASPN